MHKVKNLYKIVDVSNLSFKEKISEIEVLHSGEWEHPRYGLIEISDKDIDQFIKSFEDRVRKIDIAVDQEHMPDKGAAGWFRSLKKAVEDGVTKLKASVEWTELGKQLIKDGIFKYFSPEFDFEYEDQETHEFFKNVLLGGALTNRPYFKSLATVQLSENTLVSFKDLNTPKGGEKTMNKKELKAKLVADSSFELSEKATDEERKLFEEVKNEMASDAEEAKQKAEKEAKEVKEKEDTLKASEKFISRSEHVTQMNDLKSELGIVNKKLKFKEVTAEVKGLTFSESNPEGTILPKNEEKAQEILMSCNDKVAKLFKEFIAELPKVSSKLFEEVGKSDDGEDGDDADKLDKNAEKLMADNPGMTYSEAVKKLT